MSRDRHSKLHALFTAAVGMRVQDRTAWLERQCDGDQSLFEELRLLLAEDARSLDPLEAGLEQLARNPSQDVVAGKTKLSAMLQSFAKAEKQDGLPSSELSSDDFIDRLSEMEVLSGDELTAWLESLQPPRVRDSPRAMAKQLIAERKLTRFQAAVLLGGQSQNLLIDKYLIVDLIDSGGMGMVFKAIHRPMNRMVALKMLPPDRFASAAAVNRFRREVHVAATLQHPNIVTAFDADESKGVHFLVMEYARGRDLYKMVNRRGPLELSQAIGCILQAASGLQHAHEQGVIHRDIKPGNLILANRRTVKVLDMGLASIGQAIDTGDTESSPSGQQLTQSGSLLGTLAYMAPEQAMDSTRADARSDLYSLGCTFYFLLTGETPYGSDQAAAVAGHRSAPIPRLCDARPDVPESIDAIYQQMLAKDPDDRQQSMAELIAQLRSSGSTNESASMSGRADESSDRDAPLPPMPPAIPLSPPLIRVSPSGAEPPELPSARHVWTVGAILLAIGLLYFGYLRLPGSKTAAIGLPSRQGNEGTAESKRRPSPVVPLLDQKVDAVADSRVPPPFAIMPFDAEKAIRYRDAWAAHLNVPVEFTHPVGMKFVLIPPGEFDMGGTKEEIEACRAGGVLSPEDRGWLAVTLDSELPRHRVRISSPFYLGVYEVTRGQFRQFVQAKFYETEAEKDGRGGLMRSARGRKESPGMTWRQGLGFDQEDDHPVAYVGSADAIALCDWLTETDTSRRQYGLPSEAQWEYACRAGTDGPYACGDDESALQQHAWYAANSDWRTHAVGQREPNAFGLYDMHGNVREVCRDFWSRAYPAEFVVDPVGPADTEELWGEPAGRVVRGECFSASNIGFLRSAKRSPEASARNVGSGFRVFCSVNQMSMLAAAQNESPSTAAAQAPPADQPFRVAVNGLDGLQGIVPRVAEKGWKSGTEWAEARQSGVIEFPSLPVSSCVLEIDLTVREAKGRLIFRLGDRDYAFASLIEKSNVAESVRCWLERRQPFGSNWDRSEHVKTDRLKMQMYVGDARGQLWVNGKRATNRNDGVPVDSTLRIETKNGFAATIHSLELRPINPADYSKCGWKPPSRDALDESATTRRIAKQDEDVADLAGPPQPGSAFQLPSAQLVMNWIPEGTITLGDMKAGGKRWHWGYGAVPVAFEQGFWMGRYEVTQQQWAEVMDDNPSRVTGSKHLPVNWVGFDQALEFCENLTAAERIAQRIPEGHVYRLPTEAEWEYGCMLGGKGPYLNLEGKAVAQADMAWILDPGGRIHEVGEKQPNAWGLYDLMGNIPEWCADHWDRFGIHEGEQPVSGRLITAGRKEWRQVVRGGGYFSVGYGRHYADPHHRARRYRTAGEFIGLRVVLAPELRGYPSRSK